MFLTAENAQVTRTGEKNDSRANDLLTLEHLLDPQHLGDEAAAC